MRPSIRTLGLACAVTLLAGCGQTDNRSSIASGATAAPSYDDRTPAPVTAPAGAMLRGTWDYVMDDAEREMALEGFAGLVDTADEVVTRIGFDDHTWWQGNVFDGELFLLHGVPEGDGGSFTIPQEGVIVMYGAHGQARVTLEWMIDGDQLSLTALEECDLSGEAPRCTDDRAEMDPAGLLVFEQTFTRSSDDPTY